MALRKFSAWPAVAFYKPEPSFFIDASFRLRQNFAGIKLRGIFAVELIPKLAKPTEA